MIARGGEGRSVTEGWIFDIQGYSVHDGPGIRTVVFFKGCPLRCLWCDNPESQESYPQLFYFETLCTRCYRCVAACPTKATTVNSQGAIEIDRDRCKVCGACVKACLSEARAITGKSITVEEVLDAVKKDSQFYWESGGGVTASGGEATSQPDFLLELFKGCRDAGIHTALETCGYVRWEVLETILEYVDLVLFDIKHMDSAKHKELTGVSNELILENAAKIARRGEPPIIIRVPLIPGYNDSEENIKALGEFASKLGLSRVDLLPYHQLGENKYKKLGREYKLGEIKPYLDSQVQALCELLESYKLEVAIV